MPRATRTLAALFATGALTLPASPATADCTSTLPVSDKRLASIQCTGVHPGMGLRIPSKKWGEMTCTAGFAFTDRSGNRYLTFPGTCHLDFDCLEDTVTELLPPPLNELVLPVCVMMSESEEEPYYRRGGPVVKDLDGRRIGAIVYAVNKEDVNFGLVRIDPKVPLDPALPVYGGPTRFGDATTVPEEAYSVSAGRNPNVPNARTGLLYSMNSYYTNHQTEAFGSVSTGSPVMKPDGSAVGYYVAWTVGLGWNVHPYGSAISRASTITRLSFRLATAKLQ